MTNWHIKIADTRRTILDKGTHNYKRLVQYLQAGKGLDCTFELSANYGKALDSVGNLVSFTNTGIYSDFRKALEAGLAFQEVSKI